ncbi:porin [Vibrio hepatarius]|uniref:porin n=1 Tax=Vibrio hepatarius TaxID=171383 RepID=UPI00142D7193|nr:porin [Vibrio hepatarius]NIY81699.1 porin [Vibrio hepatarius]
MNKTLIALAVSAAAVATGANAAEIYNQDGTSLEFGGRAEARLSIKDGKAEDKTRVRLNFLGKTQITDNLYGLGFYEGEFSSHENGDIDSEADDNDLYTRLGYAGLGGEFGEVSYGKTEGALGVITDFTDIMAYHGNSAADKLSVADRTDNMIAYKGQFSDLSLKASYRFADRSTEGTGENESFTDNDQDGYSLSAIYALGDTGLKLGGGYADQDEANEYMLGVSYAIGDLYVAGLFTDGEKYNTTEKNTYDYTGYEFAAAYTIGKTVLSTTYNNAETDDETSKDNIAIDATYYFKPNFRGYVSYNFNLIDDGDTIGTVAAGNGKASDTDAEDEIALGLRYDF